MGLPKHCLQLLVAMISVGSAACGAAFGVGWAGKPYSVAIPTHFTGRGQALSSSVSMTLDHTNGSIQASVAQAGNEVLSGAGDTLVTQYMLTGARLQNGDSAWVSSSTFLTKTYSVLGADVSTVTLSVQGTSASNRANNAGAYSASIILTYTW
jgi:hypothetical protein